MGWENVFTSHICDRRLIFRMHKRLKILNDKKSNNPISKLANEKSKEFLKTLLKFLNLQVADKQMKKKSLASLAIAEMHIETTVRFCSIPQNGSH